MGLGGQLPTPKASGPGRNKDDANVSKVAQLANGLKLVYGVNGLKGAVN